MDTMEINKIVGALVGALLIYLGVQFFADMVLKGSHGDEEYAYALEIEDADLPGEPAPEIDVAALLDSADPSRGERIFGRCRACHAIEDGQNGAGPHLYEVVGREIGVVDGFNYSGALEATGEEAWTRENLYAFLENPRGWAPGTSMGFAGLTSPEDRAAVIAYLASAAE